MHRFFNCCLLAALFFVATISLPIFYNFNSVAVGSDSSNSKYTVSDIYKITTAINMTEYDNAHYCDILGGIIEAELSGTPFTTHLLSINYIVLSINNNEIMLKANTLYSLSLYNENNSAFLSVNGIQYKLLHHKISIKFLSFGAFGNIKIINHTTYHDNILKLPIDSDMSIAYGTANIFNNTIYFYPKPISSLSDTTTQFIIIDSANRLSYQTLTNKYCFEKSTSIITETYSISDDYVVTDVIPLNSNSAVEIIDNNIKFYSSGEYRITLIKGFYKTIINLSVTLPDIDPIPPEPDLPPDNGDIPDIVEPPTPPDDSEDLPPNINGDNDGLPPNTDEGDDNTDTTPPIEEILPPSSDTTDSDRMPDFNINYERQIDYVKVIIVTVCGTFTIVGIITLSVIFSKIRKRKKLNNK